MPKRSARAFVHDVEAGESTRIPFASAAVSTLVHATEDEQRVLKALRLAIPEGIEVKRMRVRGHYGNPIVLLEAKVRRKEAIQELWQNVLANLKRVGREELKVSIPRKIDDRCTLYLRFDKQRAHGGELVFSEGGDAIHFKLKVAAFPAKQEVAAKLVGDSLEKFGR